VFLLDPRTSSPEPPLRLLFHVPSPPPVLLIALRIFCTRVSSAQFREYGVLFVLHAIASLIGLSILCFGNLAHFFGCVGLLWEVTTILINNRYLPWCIVIFLLLLLECILIFLLLLL
jgi:hypothetical protein